MMTEEYKEEYKKARKAAMKQYRTCASKGWSLYPPVLDEVSAYVKTAGEEVLGEMEIPLSLVTGTRTAGRQNAFSKDFLPILPENSEFARKWITLYEAQMEEGIRDPISVDISHILGNLITVIFDYQILRKPLKILSL